MNNHEFTSALHEYVSKYENINKHLDNTFKTVVYNNGNAICMTVSKLFLLGWNNALNKALGWSDKELGNIPWLDFVHPNDRLIATWVSQGEGLFYSQDKVDFFYIRYMHKNGSYRWIKFFRQAYFYNNAWYTIGEDVTDVESEQHFLKTLEEVRNGTGNS